MGIAYYEVNNDGLAVKFDIEEHDKQIRAEALHIDMEKPMHFTDEQKAWVKNYICINAERQRAEVIDLIDRHLWNYSHEVWEDFKPILEQLKEQNK